MEQKGLVISLFPATEPLLVGVSKKAHRSLERSNGYGYLCSATDATGPGGAAYSVAAAQARGSLRGSLVLQLHETDETCLAVALHSLV